MNYIQRLKAENESYKQAAADALQELSYLRQYLLSDKFREDTTVQTSDVLRRIDPVRDVIAFNIPMPESIAQ